MWEVIVGNIGTVYSGGFYDTALSTYKVYCNQSTKGLGRSAGEDVTLMHNGEIEREFIGSNSQMAQAVLYIQEEITAIKWILNNPRFARSIAEEKIRSQED